ncbi:MAG: 16S rRNA (cytosine(1402)-N(4))-methyltransferase [Lysobacterales bacterium 69-70]|nr:16S rRNA (cytosine(1402)-N(4))-methyltransferase RsmH [Xanthomonadaceae bacterium]ODU36526.1 MAG: 16S rRNA (cytosine(1402)-N(4))-methyltransferase [Xanthomonadaceae bacterium SCN 69-320]ODV21822.1 MAG: 16S rRNA (cytosine(1402)-N(4))-methyltransferase [Xanthomonadaceae bacterium SCN 69-25]OJY96322.1 MAG: 16S rRNA (cytosine(1402)-N(4))-methyltransferase [Xanthomonadales bacterium 69-70]
MLAEAVDALAVKPDGVYLDGTFGRGGHAREVLKRLGAGGRLLLLDRDPQAIAMARAEFGQDPRVQVRHGSFADLAEWDATEGGLDGVLLDIGVSSPQLDDPQRGFSFQADAPLDMRMDTSQGESAAEFLARASEETIADVLYNYGEERMSRRIARWIVERRADQPIRTTAELAELCARANPKREPGKHPATRTFQALRIAVNGELDALQRGLAGAERRLKPGGRLVVISFHSLEDRIVKQFIRGRSQPPPARRGLPPPAHAPLTLRALGNARLPSDEEVERNPRARSAVLRVAERLEAAV